MIEIRPISVLVADDHAIVRRGISDVLADEPDIEVVGEAGSGAEALELATRLRPDLVLLDIRMPGSDGIRVTQQIRHQLPETRVLIFTSYEEDEQLHSALRAGAHGYILKTTSPERLLDAIRAVAHGERQLSPSLLDRVLSQFEILAQHTAQVEAGLTADDVAILRLIARGATNREIAGERFWSEITVKRRLHEIFRKLNVSDRTRAVAEAMSRGLI
jgi:DNA-binding NarL/FixJ family response regulator